MIYKLMFHMISISIYIYINNISFAAYNSYHMSGRERQARGESDEVARWSGGNPGFLGPSGRMLILTWIHTHTHVDKEGDLCSRIMCKLAVHQGRGNK